MYADCEGEKLRFLPCVDEEFDTFETNYTLTRESALLFRVRDADFCRTATWDEERVGLNYENHHP